VDVCGCVMLVCVCVCMCVCVIVCVCVHACVHACKCADIHPSGQSRALASGEAGLESLAGTASIY
jgi:hypothetical protein